MFGLGIGELVVILVIVLVLFGPGRLPELGGALGEGIKNFKKGYRDSKSLDVTPPGDTPIRADSAQAGSANLDGSTNPDGTAIPDGTAGRSADSAGSFSGTGKAPPRAVRTGSREGD